MSRPDYVEHLRSVQLFADLQMDTQAMEALADIMEQRVFAPDTVILREGCPGAELFIVISGSVSVFKQTPDGDPFRVAVLESDLHPTFGESALIDSESRTATIRSEGGCQCLVLNRVAFDRFSEQYPHWALPIFRRVSKTVMSRLKKANEDLMLVYKALMAEVRGQY